jgi:hypothetical protein
MNSVVSQCSISLNLQCSISLNLALARPIPGFKYELTNDETFESEFIVASKLDCQRWALEQQSQNNLVEQDFIAIADARSARDNTLFRYSIYYSATSYDSLTGTVKLLRV